MTKTKLFIENFIIYGFGGIISKIIPFVMLPIVTWLMPRTLYLGLNDLILTITSFATAFAVMGMYDAMFRMFFEKTDETFKKSVCSTALMFVSCMTVFVVLLLIVLREPIGRLFFEDRQYAYLVCFSAAAVLVGATNNIVSAPTRMQNQRRIFLVANTVGPFLSYGIAIPLLLCGHYVIALPLAAIISGLTIGISFYLLNRRWFSVHYFDYSLLRELLAFGAPLMPAFLVYWIFNSCDRVMIAQFLDVEAVGVYAIGAKVGAASHLIYTAFAGGWKYFAFSTMKEENQVKSNSMVHEYLGVVSFLAGIWMCGLVRPLFAWVFPPDYFPGIAVAPYLFLSPLILMLYQVASTQFAVIKKTWPSTLLLFFGAITNLSLNFLMIPRFGIEGAAIATLFGYVASEAIGMLVLCNMQLMVASMRFFINVGVTVIYFVIWRLWLYESSYLSLLLALAVSIGFGFLYKHELIMIAARVMTYLGEKRKVV